MRGQSPELEWREGRVPVSQRFQDPYFSLHDGLAETRHVFLAGNDLPGRFMPGFHIAELGFGTGLNLLAALEAWEEAGTEGPLRFTTFEAYPMTSGDMIRAQSAFPTLAGIAERLRPFWEYGAQRIDTDWLRFEMLEGDARETLRGWSGHANAWFLDGFAPARNPEMWDEGLMVDVARHTAAGGTAATYTAAGHVRRALADAGFAVERAPGFGRKRHMTRARIPQ